MEPATFGLRSPQDLLAKLKRELARLDVAREPADMIDHGLNFAISAWHMAEWIAQYEDCHDKLRAKLQTATADRTKLCKELRSVALAKCPELENCRVIASYAKHLECTKPPPRDLTFKANEAPGKITFVNNRNEPVTFVNNNGEPTSWISRLWYWQGGDKILAAKTFNRVFEWWRSFVETM